MALEAGLTGRIWIYARGSEAPGFNHALEMKSGGLSRGRQPIFLINLKKKTTCRLTWPIGRRSSPIRMPHRHRSSSNPLAIFTLSKKGPGAEYTNPGHASGGGVAKWNAGLLCQDIRKILKLGQARAIKIY